MCARRLEWQGIEIFIIPNVGIDVNYKNISGDILTNFKY